jgi:hypothetical protein
MEDDLNLFKTALMFFKWKTASIFLNGGQGYWLAPPLKLLKSLPNPPKIVETSEIGEFPPPPFHPNNLFCKNILALYGTHSPLNCVRVDLNGFPGKLLVMQKY